MYNYSIFLLLFCSFYSFERNKTKQQSVFFTFFYFKMVKCDIYFIFDWIISEREQSKMKKKHMFSFFCALHSYIYLPFNYNFAFLCSHFFPLSFRSFRMFFSSDREQSREPSEDINLLLITIINVELEIYIFQHKPNRIAKSSPNFSPLSIHYTIRSSSSSSWRNVVRRNRKKNTDIASRIASFTMWTGLRGFLTRTRMFGAGYTHCIALRSKRRIKWVWVDAIAPSVIEWGEAKCTKPQD